MVFVFVNFYSDYILKIMGLSELNMNNTNKIHIIKALDPTPEGVTALRGRFRSDAVQLKH